MTYEDYFATMRGIHRELAVIAERTEDMALTGQGDSDQLRKLLSRQAELIRQAADCDAAVVKAHNL